MLKKRFHASKAAGLLLASAFVTAALSSAALAEMVEGGVKKVDAAAGKISLKHGPIPKLDMGEMTMVYQVKDPALLSGIKAGDKVKFDAEEVGGKYTVTKIEKSK